MGNSNFFYYIQHFSFLPECYWFLHLILQGSKWLEEFSIFENNADSQKNSYLPPLNIVRRICHQDWMPRYFWNWNKASAERWLWNNLRGINSSYMTEWQYIAMWPSTVALTPVYWARFPALVLLWPALTLLRDGGFPIGLTSGVLFVITWSGSGQILGFCTVTWQSHQDTCMYFNIENIE